MDLEVIGIRLTDEFDYGSVPVSCKLLLEDGSGFLILEDGSGYLDLENCSITGNLLMLEDATGFLLLENGSYLLLE